MALCAVETINAGRGIRSGLFGLSISDSQQRGFSLIRSPVYIMGRAIKVSFLIRDRWPSGNGHYERPTTMSSRSGKARTFIGRGNDCACLNHFCSAPVPMRTCFFRTAIQAASLA